MTTITAKYSKRHTTGMSVWDLDDLGVDINTISDYDIKWDRLTIWFNDDRDDEEYLPTEKVVVFDEDNGHEWIKHPMSVKASFKIKENA